MNAPQPELPYDFRIGVELIRSLSLALHQSGVPSYKLEESMGNVARRLNIPLQMLGMPTGILLNFPRDQEPITHVLRVFQAGVHLERIELLTAVVDQVCRGILSPELALQRVREIVHLKPRWGPWAIVIAYLFSATAFAVFFQGGFRELWVSMAVGLSVGLLAAYVQPRVRPGSRFFELIAAAVSALVAGLADNVLGQFSEWVPLAAGLIILLPGISLVDAIEELAHGHLASGGARLAGVGVAFLALTFGTVLGTQFSEMFPNSPTVRTPESLPGWVIGPALLVLAVGSTIRFRAQPSDVIVIFIASAVAFAGSKLGTYWLGSVEGPFLGAVLLGLAGFLYSRISSQAAEIFLVPGLAVLVPGSFGLRSMASLLDHQTILGIETAFEMFLIAMALVAGLLISSWLVRETVPDDDEV